MLDKLHVVADYEGRSANGEISVLIRKEIERYEKSTENTDKLKISRPEKENVHRSQD